MLSGAWLSGAVLSGALPPPQATSVRHITSARTRAMIFFMTILLFYFV
ncbi:MAG: hypothetical protein ACOX81_06660 [Candidatus Heteroscillospira sp.]